MLNCKQISLLVSESFEKPLTWGQRMQLWMHLGMCGLCFRFSKIMKRLDHEVQGQADAAEKGELGELFPDEKLSPDCRNRIVEAMESEQE